ncbi:hypothetical protein EUGRSUZ_C02881 [Eucalyptus grandis]|uniref:Uncharacterized protein n=2 Tax=Eucalyptus grandis TaxID=71139 RepID=A0A059CUA7_EUCGR|nr:hypothetical protein EUGRSUZ_C02881 [Eucalyptus grandis]
MPKNGSIKSQSHNTTNKYRNMECMLDSLFHKTDNNITSSKNEHIEYINGSTGPKLQKIRAIIQPQRLTKPKKMKSKEILLLMAKMFSEVSQL